jgi:formate dehydrogenase subunit gamma
MIRPEAMMMEPSVRASLIRRALAFAILFICLGLSAMPSEAQQPQSSPPTAAEGQAPFVDPDASAVQEHQLLQEFPRIEGTILIPDQRESVLIQPAGRVWRYFHEVLLHWVGGALILGVIALLTISYFLIGRMRISSGRSGFKLRRFTPFERFSHWLTAFSFVVLALTGLNITFGKLLLMPLIGHDAFGRFAEAAKYVHNFTSFSFVLGLGLIVSIWLKDNIPGKIDFLWLKEGGGFIRGKHPPAGRFNAGEKLVFWFALGGGLLVVVSGFLLLFPFYLTNIFDMQITQVVHAVIAVLFVALILGHIYIGTLGMEGAFEAMGTGYVDLNWAKEHHSLWLEQELAKGNKPVPPSEAFAAPAE